MKYKSYKNFLEDLVASFPTYLQPANVSRTVLASFNSCFRLPTFTFEPYFVDRFGPIPEESFVEPTPEIINEIRVQSAEKFSSRTLSHPKLNRITFAKALDATIELMGLRGCMFAPLSITDAGSNVAKNTSSGFPDYQSKIDVLENVTQQAILCLFNKDKSFIDIPVTLAWRTQMRKSGLKYRLIWLVPFIIIIFEATFFLPIIGHIRDLQTTSYCIGNTFEMLARRWSNLQRFKNIYSLDYELYDSTISMFLINLFLSSMKEKLKLNMHQNWLYECLREFHLNALVITGQNGEATCFRKGNGLLSGSMITNICGSFVNIFCISYFLIDHGIDPRNSSISVMSDDCLFGCNEDFTLDYIHDYFMDKFNISVSSKKSEIYKPSQPVFFLGSYIDANIRYIDYELVKKQLRLTTSFNTELSEFDRVFSKLCSSLFKYTYGWYYFQEEIPYLLERFGVDSIPEYYVDLSTPSGGPTELSGKYRSVREMMFEGWRRQ